MVIDEVININKYIVIKNDMNELATSKEEHFINHFLKVKSIKSKNTAKSYKSDILDFFKLFSNSNSIENITISDVRKVNILNVQKWIIYLQSRNLSSATISRKNHSLSALYKWLLKTDGVKNNPFYMTNDDLPTVNSKETESLTNEEVKRIMLCIKDDSIKDIRDKAIISLFITTALRKSELLNIKISDIVTVGKFNLIKITGKGNKEDYVKLRDDVKMLIDRYLNKTNRSYSDKDFYLFSNLKEKMFDKPLNKNSLNKIIKSRCQNANIVKNITVHSLRHTSITLAVQSNNFSIEQVRDFARHRSIATTNRYIHNNTKYENYCGDIIQF